MINGKIENIEINANHTEDYEIMVQNFEMNSGCPSRQYYCPNCMCEYCNLHNQESLRINFTHNLVPMAELVGIYEVLWHPTENEYRKGYSIIGKLKKSITDTIAGERKLRELEPSNKYWGSYENFLEIQCKILSHAIKYPDQAIESYGGGGIE